MTLRTICAALALCLAACDPSDRSGGGGNGGGGGGDHGGCIGSFIGGSVQNGETSCVGCSSSPEHGLAWDGDASTSADYAFGTGTSNAYRGVRAQSGVVFPAGNFAGALMNIPVDYAGSTIGIATYMGLTPQETLTPANSSEGDLTAPSGADEYYGFVTTLPFDTVRVTLTGGAAGTTPPAIRVYEFCSER